SIVCISKAVLPAMVESKFGKTFLFGGYSINFHAPVYPAQSCAVRCKTTFANKTSLPTQFQTAGVFILLYKRTVKNCRNIGLFVGNTQGQTVTSPALTL